MAGFAGSAGPGRGALDMDGVVRALSFTGCESVSHAVLRTSSWVSVAHAAEALRLPPVFRGHDVSIMLHGYITGVEGLRERPAGGVLAACAELYREEGPGFARRLNGSFALAIEEDASGEVHLVSDRLGTRSVYYHSAPGFFAFATRLEAIRRVNPAIADRISGSALAVFLALGRLLEGSMLEEVRMLDPACVLTYDGARLVERRYWRPSFSYSANPLGIEDNARLLARAMEAAVADSVRGWERTGLLLSGGLDSRTVLSFLNGRNTTCYTICDRRNLETRLAEKSAGHLGAVHVKLERGADHYIDMVPGAARICEGSFEYDHAHLEGLWDRIDPDEDRVFLSGYGMNSVMRTFYLSKLNDSLRMRSSFDRAIKGLDSVEAVEEQLLRLLGSGRDALMAMSPELRRDAAGYPREALRRFLAAYDSCVESPVDLLDLYLFVHTCRTRTFPFIESLRQRFPERCPSFDNRVLTLAASVPPQQRFDSRISRRALMLIDPRLALQVDANNCVPAALGGSLATVCGKALKTVERVPTAVRKRLSRHDGLWLQKAGSWHDLGVLWRWSGIWKELDTLLDDEAAMRDGLISADGVRDLFRNHLEGSGYHHTVFIRVLSFLEWRRSWA